MQAAVGRLWLYKRRIHGKESVGVLDSTTGDRAMTYDSFLEDEILTACALRFDGYIFRETNKRRGLNNYKKAPLTSFELHPYDLFNQTRFFFLQRYLYKWGGRIYPLGRPGASAVSIPVPACLPSGNSTGMPHGWLL